MLWYEEFRCNYLMCDYQSGTILSATAEVFLLNVLNDHYQVCVWNSCLQPRPQETDPYHVKYIECHYRIRVSPALCLSFCLFTFICLEIEHWRRKKCLLDHFSPYFVILLNVYSCIKHNNFFLLYLYHYNYHKAFVYAFSGYYSLLFLLNKFRVELDWH